jgi:hypothetical protein
MKIIVHSNPLGASPEFYKEHPGVIAGCFGSNVFYYVSRWTWSHKREEAATLDKDQAEQVLVDARVRYEHLKSYQPIKIEFTVVER